MNKKCCSGDGQAKKAKRGGGGKIVCDKIVCVKDSVCQRCGVKNDVSKMICGRWCVPKWCDKDGV